MLKLQLKDVAGLGIHHPAEKLLWINIVGNARFFRGYGGIYKTSEKNPGITALLAATKRYRWEKIGDESN